MGHTAAMDSPLQPGRSRDAADRPGTDRAGWDERYRAAAVWKDGPNAALVHHLPVIDGTAQARRPPTALDLACGQGGDAIWLATRGWDVVAVDWAGAALDRARATARDRGAAVRFVEGDVTDVALLARLAPQGGFDLVTVAFLHPDPERRAAHYAHLPALLAPGGHLLVIAHPPEHAARGLPGPPPARLLDPVSALAALHLPNGFEVLVSDTWDRRTRDGAATSDTVVIVRRATRTGPTGDGPGGAPRP